jgi:hypothetical protein
VTKNLSYGNAFITETGYESTSVGTDLANATFKNERQRYANLNKRHITKKYLKNKP